MNGWRACSGELVTRIVGFMSKNLHVNVSSASHRSLTGIENGMNFLLLLSVAHITNPAACHQAMKAVVEEEASPLPP